MVLFIIGIGLGDAKDITVRGLEAVRSCGAVYLEGYTSLLVDANGLEALYGRPVLPADRAFVEGADVADAVVARARAENVAFLVVGDAFGATTHADLVLRARAAGVDVRVVHNAGIMNAVGCCGLQLYSFGQAVSLCLWAEGWRPDSWYPKLRANRRNGMHTLCLLDIRVKEPTAESLCRGRRGVYEPPRFMTAAQAARQLLDVEQSRGEGVLAPDTWAVALARVGSSSDDDGGDAEQRQRIVYAPLSVLCDVDMGPPLHCLVVPAPELHPLEEEFLAAFKLP